MSQRKKKHRRRRGRGSFGPFLRLVSLVLTAVVIVIALTLFFKVEHITVKGNERYAAEEIIAACGVLPGDNLVLLDKHTIAETLYTQLPYITGVRINRDFPDGLTITIEETHAALAMEDSGTWWLISAQGKILEEVDESAAQNYLLLAGMDAQSPATGAQLQLSEESHLSTQRLLELVAELSDRGMLEKTHSIHADNPKILVLEYDGRFRVELFYHADLKFKLDCLRAAVNELEPNETGIIRMTMDNENEVRLIPFGNP